VRRRGAKVQRVRRAETSLRVRHDPRHQTFGAHLLKIVIRVFIDIEVGHRDGLALRVRDVRRERPPVRLRQQPFHLIKHGRRGVHLTPRAHTRHQRPVHPRNL
jgi:hypothetical protein